MKKKILVLFVALFALVGCEKDVDDGVVPEKYRADARQYEGTFAGEFEGRTVVLNFNIDSAGRAILTAQGLDRSPYLISSCNSQIGRLKSVNVSKRSHSLQYARFAFDGRACGLSGRELIVEADGPDQLNLAIAETEEWVTDYPGCYRWDYPDFCSPTTRRVVSSWLTGKFYRQQQ